MSRARRRRELIRRLRYEQKTDGYLEATYRWISRLHRGHFGGRWWKIPFSGS